MKRLIPLILLVLTITVLIVVFPGCARADTRTLSPYFWVESGEDGQPHFPLKATRVTAHINGVIADVRVTQEYTNEGTRPINARYIFPASTRAAVHGMQMIVGEETIKARIQERREARKTFEKAKAVGQSAGLLEEQRPNVFSMNVANIMPGESITVELHYSELLVPEEGVYAFIYPTVVGPRYSNEPEAGATDHHQWLKNPYLLEGREPLNEFEIQVVLSAGLPLQEVACSTHDIDIAWDSEFEATVDLSPGETRSGNRDFMLNYRLASEAIHSGVMLHQGETENFFLLMVQPPVRVNVDAMPPREYIFVLDVSGSMHGFPLDTAKELMQQLLAGLRPADRFNLILFAGGARMLAAQSVSATAARVKAALELIDGQQGGGGTELALALKKGLGLPCEEGFARTMVVVTDGYIAAEKEVFGLIADHIGVCNIFTFGIGSSVNRYLIEGLARAGQGEPFVVTDPSEAAATAARFKHYIDTPVLTHIDIDLGAFGAYDMEPIHQPDLFAMRPLIVCGKWRGAPRGIVTIRGITGAGDYVEALDMTRIAPLNDTGALPFLWARKRLTRLSDLSWQPESETTRQQIIQLGLQYSLLTPHTSFVAVHEPIRNPDTPAKDVDQPLPLPLHVSNLAIGGRQVPEPGIHLVLAAAVIVMAIAGLRRRNAAACVRS